MYDKEYIMYWCLLMEEILILFLRFFYCFEFMYFIGRILLIV